MSATWGFAKAEMSQIHHAAQSREIRDLIPVKQQHLKVAQTRTSGTDVSHPIAPTGRGVADRSASQAVTRP